LHIVHVMRRSFDKKNSPKMLWGVCIFFSRKIPKKNIRESRVRFYILNCDFFVFFVEE